MESLYAECLDLGPAADSDEAVYVFAESVLYLIGATGAFDFQRHIRPFCRTMSAKMFRLRLREHRYTNLDVKLFMLRASKFGTTMRGANVLAAQHGIAFRDFRLMWMLVLDNLWFSKLVQARAKENVETGALLEYYTINKQFNDIYPTILKYIKHVTYTKLRFLVKSTNSTYQDYHSELSIKLVQSYYSLVPIQLSEPHLINYLKRSVHNHAINMIKSGTTQKRGRMVSTEANEHGVRKFDMLCLSQNQMAPTADGQLQDVDGLDFSAAVFELRFSMGQLVDSLNLGGKKHRFLSIILGAEDKEFSTWLQTHGHCRSPEDNVDLQHVVSAEAYTSLIADFLNVRKKQVDVFFDSLKTQLAW